MYLKKSEKKIIKINWNQVQETYLLMFNNHKVNLNLLRKKLNNQTEF